MRTGEREAFERMHQMRSIDFAREESRALADALALDPEAPTPVWPGRRRGAGTARLPVR